MMRRSYMVLLLAAMLLALPFAGIAQAKEAKSLNLSLQGAILDIESHFYSHEANKLVMANIMGHMLTQGSSFSYELKALVKGFEAKGSADLELSGRSADGARISLHASIVIAGMEPAERFPAGCQDNGCTSAIAAFYLGQGIVKLRVDPPGKEGQTVSIPMAFALESAHLNPFGNPIVVLSVDGQGNPDGSVIIIAKYQKATIQWKGVKLGGIVQGTFGDEQVQGNFVMNVQAEEDLYKGTEKETGTIALVNMSNPLLNVAGSFRGTSTIPPSPSIDCSPPGFPNTCALTGFASQGSFTAFNSLALIRGSYSLVWSIPAVAFTGSAEASVTSK